MASDLRVLRRKRTVKKHALEKRLFVQFEDMMTKEFSEEVRVEAVAMRESLPGFVRKISLRER